MTGVAPTSESSSAERGPVRRFARSRARLVLVLWIGLCVVVLTHLSREGMSLRGDLFGLVPPEHQPRLDEPLLLLRLDPEAATVETAPGEILLSVGATIGEALGPERVPIAPPATEVGAWLDAHALYLLPLDTHDELRRRLTEPAMISAVEGLRARLSSPFFNLSSEEARRDPLGLRTLTADAAGRYGHLDAIAPASAEVTPRGDLLAHDGTALLVQLRSERPADELLSAVRTAVAAFPVTVDLVGPVGRQHDAARLLETRAPRLALAALAGIAIVLAASFRKLRPALAVLLGLATGLGVVVTFGPPIDPLSFPLLVLLLGFSCEGALHLQRISERGWPGAIVLGCALLPLWLSPYPTWKAWSLWWAAAVAVMLLVLRVLLPAILAVVRGSVSWEQRGFLLRPMGLVAIASTASILALGAFASEKLVVRGGDRILLGETEHAKAEAALVEDFFDPSLVVEARTSGADAGATLARAAVDARELAELVPDRAMRIDSPGMLVLRPDELELRRRALEAIDLKQSLRKLREILEARGFHADAFGEFLRGAADSAAVPTPDAALDGPLGPWIARYVDPVGGQTTIRTFVHLRGDAEAPLPVITTAEGQPLELRGPAAAARLDRPRFRDWLGVYVLCQLWIGAFVVWLGTRSLAIALSSAFAALVTITAVIALMVPLRIPLSPLVVPALLLAGAAAVIAAGRACRAFDLRRPFFAMGLLVTSLCQVAVGLALVASGVDAWVHMGLVTSTGAAIASFVGLFVAPGLTRTFRHATRSMDRARPGSSADARSSIDRLDSSPDSGEDDSLEDRR